MNGRTLRGACARMILCTVLAVLVCLAGLARAGEDEAGAPALSRRQILYLTGLVRARMDREDLDPAEQALLEEVAAALKATPPDGADRPSRAVVEERLKDYLRTAVARDPDARDPRLALARYYLFADDPERAKIHLERIGPASEDDVFWPLLAGYTYLRLGEHEPAARILQQAVEAAGRLMPLSITRAVLCESVRRHGQYTPRDQDALRPGETTAVYLEVTGPSFAKQAGHYRLRLRFGVAVRDRLERTVYEEPEYASIDPTYQHPVRAVFAGMFFRVPEDLPAGEYVLLVTCRDRTSGRTATADVPFTVRGSAPGR